MGAVDLDDGWALHVIAFPVGDVIGNGWSWMMRAARGRTLDRATDTGEVIGSRRLGVDAGNKEHRTGE